MELMHSRDLDEEEEDNKLLKIKMYGVKCISMIKMWLLALNVYYQELLLC